MEHNQHDYIPEYSLRRHPNSTPIPAYPIGMTHDEALRQYYVERLHQTRPGHFDGKVGRAR